MLSLGLSHKSKYISNITRLYLNDCRLTKLPNFLSQLTNIQERDLKKLFYAAYCMHTYSIYNAFLIQCYVWTPTPSKKYPKQESFLKRRFKLDFTIIALQKLFSTLVWVILVSLIPSKCFVLLRSLAYGQIWCMSWCLWRGQGQTLWHI